MREFIAPKTDRLDRLLRDAALPGSEWMSRPAWDALIEGGGVLVDGRSARKAGGEVRAGARVEVGGEPGEWGLLPGERAAAPVWLDEAGRLGVFFKDCGVDSVPLLPWDRSAFASQVARYLSDRKLLEPADFARLAEPPRLEGGLLQRLDRDTSGLLCVAFDPATKALFRQLFSRSSVEKTYRALVRGSLDAIEGVHRLYYQTEGGTRVRAFSAPPRGKVEEAELRVRICKKTGNSAEVEVVTCDGLRHVVRAGLALLGAPLVGDLAYGGAADAPFHQLHAEKIRLLDAKAFAAFPAQVEAPPPESFLDSRRRLGLS